MGGGQCVHKRSAGKERREPNTISSNSRRGARKKEFSNQPPTFSLLCAQKDKHAHTHASTHPRMMILTSP
jgi:hypothetical protein